MTAAKRTGSRRPATPAVEESIVLDCADLEYISSAGIGTIMETYRRLLKSGRELTLVQMRPRVRNVFHYAGLDRVLRIE